jgi:hypothetical protein
MQCAHCQSEIPKMLALHRLRTHLALVCARLDGQQPEQSVLQGVARRLPGQAARRKRRLARGWPRQRVNVSRSPS